MIRSCALLTAAFALAGSAFGQSVRPDISWLAGGHCQPLVSVAYSPDGTMLASAGHFSDSTIKLWRESDGSMIRTMTGSAVTSQIYGPMFPITFLRDGKTIIAFGEASALGYWNVADGSLIRTAAVGGSDLALDPTGTMIAAASISGNYVRLVRVSDGTLVRQFSGPTAHVERVAFSPDGSSIAGGDANGNLTVWRVSDGTVALNIPAHSLDFSGVRYTPDGSMIATASYDQTVKLWNATTGMLVATLTGHSAFIECMKLSPDGHWLVSGSDDDTVRIYDLTNGAFVTSISAGSSVYDVAFNPSSARLAVATNTELREYNVGDWSLVRSLVRASQAITCAKYSPDGTRFVTAGFDGVITVRDFAGAELLRLSTSLGAYALAIAPDGNSFVTGMVDKTIRHYRTSDGALLHTFGINQYIYAASYSPAGGVLATGHLDNTVRLWNTTDYSLRGTLNGHTGQVSALAYTSDGSFLLSASADGTVRVWDSSGGFVRSLTGAGQALNSLAISPDNQFAVAGGANGNLTVWRISTGQLVSSTTSGQGSVGGIAFTPSGYAFYTYGTGDVANIKVWRFSDLSLLATYTTETGGVSSGGSPTQPIDVSPTGRMVGFGRPDATAVVAFNTLISVPTSFSLVRGVLLQGTVQDLATENGVGLVLQNGLTLNSQEAPVQVDLFSHAVRPNPTSLAFTLRAGASSPGLQQEVWLFNFQTSAFELVDARPAATADQTSRLDLGTNFARFLDASGNVRARLQFRRIGLTLSSSWLIRIDQAIWSAGL